MGNLRATFFVRECWRAFCFRGWKSPQGLYNRSKSILTWLRRDEPSADAAAPLAESVDVQHQQQLWTSSGKWNLRFHLQRDSHAVCAVEGALPPVSRLSPAIFSGKFVATSEPQEVCRKHYVAARCFARQEGALLPVHL